MKLFAQLSDSQFQMLVTACVGVALAALNILQSWLQGQSTSRIQTSVEESRKDSKEAAEKAQETARTVKQSSEKRDEKLNEIAAVGQVSHGLLNSGNIAQLKMQEKTLWKLANLTKEHSDLADAEAASQVVKDYEAEQEKLNRKVADVMTEGCSPRREGDSKKGEP